MDPEESPSPPIDPFLPDDVPLDDESLDNVALDRWIAELRTEDAADDATFNRILWKAIKGPSVPYPGPTRASAKELKAP